MKKWFACGLMMIGLAVPAIGAAAEFAQDTRYSEEVVSVSPYRIKYVLKGQSHFQPSDFPSLGITGQAILIFSMGDKHIMVHSDGLYVDSPDLYLWPFTPMDDVDSTNPIQSIYAPVGRPFSLMYIRSEDRSYRLDKEFIVELKNGFAYRPEQVHMQMVYPRGKDGPLIDVFWPEF